MNRLLSALALLLVSAVARAEPFDPELEARVRDISAELRCLVCQNQTIADSEASLAVDLRREVRDMLLEGRSPPEIRDFMVQRYGDFVLYTPPVKPQTWLLWFGPALFVVLGGWVLARHLRGQSPVAAKEDAE